MPNASYTAKYEESIFDIAIKLYGSVDCAVKLLLENSTEIEDINTDLEGIEVVFDNEFKGTNVVPLVTTVQIKNLSQTYKPTSFQTIFDVALMLDGNLSDVVGIVKRSTLNNVNTEVKITDSFPYTEKKSGILDWVRKTGQVFQTKTPIEGNTGREHSSAFDRLSHT